MDEVDPSRRVFVTAQGLLMYFEEADVQRLFTTIVERFPGVELAFDTIPRWFSAKTLWGFHKTAHYEVPPMPWGVSRDEIDHVLRRWSPRVERVRAVPYGRWRGIGACALRTFGGVPGCATCFR